MIRTAAITLMGAGSAVASQWYVAPDGKASNPGTEESPWDIASALEAKQKVSPGDTVFLLSGTYRRRPKENYEVRLVGTEDEPIHICPAPGGRATIDGGLLIQEPAAHLWFQDIEIMVSEPRPEEPVEAGSHPKSYTRPGGGLHMYSGVNCKYINLVIHDCNQGISCWVGEKDCEIYGCIIYDNGWLGKDRGHGHCIYTQNQEGIKAIRQCILTCKYPGTFTMHAYGSERAYVDNFLIEENIAYELGRFLVGGGRPSRNIRVFDNVLSSVDMQIGYDAPHNENCEIRGNLIVDGKLSINRYNEVVEEDNLILDQQDERREGTTVRWLPNKYDPDRAHLAVFNGDDEGTVDIDAKPFLKKGDVFHLLDPKDIYGEAVYRGTCEADRITIPMEGEFGVFVVLREEPH